MSTKELAERFSHDLDHLLQEAGVSDLPETPGDYQADLALARRLAATDFSQESQIKYGLKHRLLHQLEPKAVSTVEIPGPLRLVANLFTRRRSAQPGWARPTSSRRLKFTWVALAGLMGIVGLVLAGWWVQPQPAPSLLSALVQILLGGDKVDPPLSRQLRVQWEFRGQGGIGAAPAADGNFIYTGGNDGYVYALDVVTGRTAWQFQTHSPIEVPPTVADDTVYTGSGGTLYALDKITGVPHWQFDMAISASPTATGDSLYVPGQDGHLIALDLRTGQERWRFTAGGALASSPIVAGDTVYVGSRDRYLYAIDTTAGQQRWRYRTGNWVASTPAIAGEMIFFGSNDEFIYALDAATGDEKWRFKTGNDVFASPAVADGLVIVGSYDGTLYALEAESGRQRWQLKTGKPIKSSALVADQIVYFGGGDGNLYAVEAQSGRILDRLPVGSQVYADPARSGQTIFVVNGKGQLQAVESAASTPDQPELRVPAADNPPSLPDNPSFQFAPGAWYAAGSDSAVRFQGQIVDEAGRPVDGFSVQIDNGSRSLLSEPSGSNRWQPEMNPGRWQIVLDNPAQAAGWWWLTIGRYNCPVAAEFNAQCEQFVPLSESVKVEIVYPDETVINADWICHAGCETGVKP
ncbi:MAG: PQQ-like beta-propeller repeat protein [Anaerolineae bacterium]|nr:PQQ-like beta-propeller repeat protein [Anaerolineae bacterium]